MNSTFELNAGGLPPASALPFSLLALVELAQLKRNYAQFLNAPPEEDRWFVMRGKEALPPLSFREVLWLLAKGQGPLAVLREADAEQEPTPWQTIEYQPCTANRATVLAATIGFWAIAVFLGWVAVATFAPREHSAMCQWGYFVAALALVGWFSLPGRVKGKSRR